MDSGRSVNLAESVDRYSIYQKAVQNPATDIEFINHIFHEMRGRQPLTLREDFCGTALLSTEWASSDGKRRALAVDISREPLDWGLKHNLEPAGTDVRNRVELVHSDVLDYTGPGVDLVCAMNFSFNALMTREELQHYFRKAGESLCEDGIFICEMYGGTEAVMAAEEEREGEGFTYHWEQEWYNPLTHEMRCHIHFSFPDGSRIERAFSYDWRLWTVPEVRECLMEAGFKGIRIFWEQVDEEGTGTGEYLETTEEENQETWLIYIVASP